MTQRFWSGGALLNDRWSDKDNWAGKVVPQANDEIVFPAGIGTLDKGSNQNIDNAVFKSITFQDAGFKITGKPITLTGDLNKTNLSGIDEIATDIIFTAATHNLNAFGQLTLSGSLKGSGTGQIVKTGLGGIVFNGSVGNSLTLPLVVNTGSLTFAKSNGAAGYSGSSVTAVGTINGAQPNLGIQQDNAIPSTASVRIETFHSATVPAGIFISAGHTLRTGPLTIVAATINGPGNLVFNGNVTAEFSQDSTLSPVISVGQVNLGAKSRTITVKSGVVLDIQSPILEPAGTTPNGQELRKEGDGALAFSRPDASKDGNSYRGMTTVAEGTLLIDNSTPFKRLIPGDLTIGLPGSAKLASFESKVPQSISTTSHILVQGAGQFNVADEGIASLDVRDNGVIRQALGSLFNNHLPALNATAATFSGNGGISALTGLHNYAFRTTLVTGTSLVSPGGTIRFTEEVTLNGGHLEFHDLIFEGNVTTLASAVSSTIKGRVRFDKSAATDPILAEGNFNIADGPAADDLLIDGKFLQGTLLGRGVGEFNSGGNEFRKKGAGTLTINNTAQTIPDGTLKSTFTLQEGSMIMSAASFQGNIDTNNATVAGVSGAILGGTGAVNLAIISSGHTLAPGNRGVGVFTSRVVAISGGSRLQIQLNGLTAGTQHDQVKTERANIGQGGGIVNAPILDVQVGFTTALNQTFKIVDITDPTETTASNTKTFKDTSGNLLNEGSTFIAGGVAFRISYVGGDGNDITITRINTPPAFQHRTITPVIDEGGVATITGLITEPDVGDTFFLDVNWDDGTTETFTFAPDVPRQVAVSHRYLDDLHTLNPRDAYKVHLVWHDQNGGSNSADLTTIVRNVAPQVSALKFDAAPALGRTSVLRGTVYDRGPLDRIRLRINWGDGSGIQIVELPAGATTFALNHVFTRAGNFRVSVQAIDNNQVRGLKIGIRVRINR